MRVIRLLAVIEPALYALLRLDVLRGGKKYLLLL